jgi:hypothetical protein
MVFVLGSQPHTGTIVEPQPAPFGLALRNFQSFLPPDSQLSYDLLSSLPAEATLLSSDIHIDHTVLPIQ